MGNVFAASSSKDFPAQFARIPGRDRNALSNPGTLQDINKKVKDLTPMLFEGAKIVACKAITPNISFKHAFHLSSVTPSGYRFGASYCGGQDPEHTSTPLLYAEVSPAGDISGIFSHRTDNNISVRAFTQLHQKKQVSESSVFLDYAGSSYTGSFYVCDINHLYESGSVLLHYLQSITTKVALGAEFTYRWDTDKTDEEFTMLSLAGRYCSGPTMLCATVSPHALDVYFYQKASPKLHIGTEFSCNLTTNKSVAAILYRIDLETVSFKGLVNSDWNVGATCEKCLCSMPITFVFSGLLNHNNGQFRMGIGMQTE